MFLTVPVSTPRSSATFSIGSPAPISIFMDLPGDDDVLRIGVHVGHRGEVNIEAVAVEVGADGVAALVSIPWVASGADGPIDS